MDVDTLNGELRESGAAMDESLLVHVLWQLPTA
jgi:hypothetical protein